MGGPARDIKSTTSVSCRPIAGLGHMSFTSDMADEIARSANAIRDHIVGTLRREFYVEEPICDEAELYYDLHLAGDDLADAIDAIRKPFGTDFSLMDLRRYAPNEVGHRFGLNFLREFREWRGERTYRSLTVASIIHAVQAGSWNDL